MESPAGAVDDRIRRARVRFSVVAAVLIGLGAGIAIAGHSHPATGVDPALLSDPRDTYDPVAAGEPIPEGFRQLLRRDGIRPLYAPVFVESADADWDPDILVLGAAIGEDARAYPVSALNVHEMVNDRIAGIPVLISWCPLCGTALVHRRQIDGQEVIFGNHGALWNNAMTWWDHDTGSVWSQPLGEAILGPRRGVRLELLPSTLTTWESWLGAHPAGLALDALGLPMVVDLDDLAIVLEFGSEAVAYEFDLLRLHGVANDVVAGVEVAVVIDPDEEQRWAVFSRRLDDVVVDLTIEEGQLVDVTTGTVFDPVRGIGEEGILRGKSLDVLPGVTVLPKDFGSFWPHGRFWVPDR